MAGVKAGEKISYDKQIRHFGGLRTTFNKEILRIDSGFRGHHIPKWEDMKTWKNYHKHYPTVYTDEKKQVTLATPEELRDFCYGLIAKQQGKWDNCNASSGWCENCTIQEGWYQNDA